jgi:hypothetical protein
MTEAEHHIHDRPHVEIVVAIDRATRVPWDCLLREIKITREVIHGTTQSNATRPH